MAVNVKAESITSNGVRYKKTGKKLIAVGYDSSKLSKNGKITLKEGTTKIKPYSFKECKTLKSIKIPGSVKTIRGYEFFACTNLDEVIIEDGVEVIEPNSFCCCENLKSITIPRSVKIIGQGAFSGCDLLKRIDVQEGYDTSIFCGAGFTEVTDTTFKFDIFEGQREGRFIFPNDTFELDNGVEYLIHGSDIIAWSFDESKLGTRVTLKEGTAIVSDFAFDGSGLESVTIPGSVKAIGTCAFFRCENLESIRIPKSVKSIGEGALFCRALYKIYVYRGYDMKLFEKSGIRVSGDEKTFTNSEGEEGEFIFYEDIKPVGGTPIRHYVDSKGETSVEITGAGMFWLREESTDAYTGKTTHAWYGIDNSEGVFEKGSRFYVQWLNDKENPAECIEVLENFDTGALLREGWNNTGYIFKVGVIDPYGEKYTELNGKTVKLHVQLGDDWNLKSLKAYWIGSGNADDQSVNITSGRRKAPEKGTYGIRILKHFSPYIVLDDPLGGDEEATDDSQLQVFDLENGKATGAAKNTSGSQKQTGDLISIVFIGVLGMLTMLSAAYLMIQKRKNSSRF